MSFMENLTSIGSSPELRNAYAEFSEGSYTASFSSFSAIDSPEAEYCSAFHYMNGRGVRKDPKKAFSLYVSSMERGYVPAVSEVAQCYGYGIGVKCDDAKAFELFAKAAEEGDPYGMSMLSMMYGNGDGVKRDVKKADEWASKCEDAGDMDEVEEAGLDLLCSGNTILARMYLMRSAVMGSPVSAKALSIMFYHGVGVCKDDDEYSDWNDTADDNGWDEVSEGDLRGHEEWFAQYIDLDDLAEDE